MILVYQNIENILLELDFFLRFSCSRSKTGLFCSRTEEVSSVRESNLGQTGEFGLANDTEDAYHQVFSFYLRPLGMYVLLRVCTSTCIR